MKLKLYTTFLETILLNTVTAQSVLPNDPFGLSCFLEEGYSICRQAMKMKKKPEMFIISIQYFRK